MAKTACGQILHVLIDYAACTMLLPDPIWMFHKALMGLMQITILLPPNTVQIYEAYLA